LNKTIARIKRLVKLGMGFFSSETARRTLEGYEAMNMFRHDDIALLEKARRFWPCNDVDSEISHVFHAEELMQPRRPIVQELGSGGTPIEARQACTASLYQLYAPALFEYIRRHAPDLTDAEDILAEVFTGALRQDLTTLTPGEQRAWLWTVARNKVNDQYRQGQRRQQVSLESLGEIGEMLQDATTPEQFAL
jgi:hypothetical protein